MHFVQLKVDFRDFSWFCQVWRVEACPAGPEPPEASRAATEQSLSEDLEDFISSGQGFGRFYKNLQDSPRNLIESNDFFEGFQNSSRFLKLWLAWASPGQA